MIARGGVFKLLKVGSSTLMNKSKNGLVNQEVGSEPVMSGVIVTYEDIYPEWKLTCKYLRYEI